MDTLINELNTAQAFRGITINEFLIAMILSLILNTILAYVYNYFNKSYSNPESVTRTIVLIGIIITLIMVIIGSNIARAFALVGAMSIVRFRNPLKDPKDLTFIFASIALGMACGTFFYEYAVIFLAVFIAANLILDNLKISRKNENFNIFKIKYESNKIDNLSKIFKKNQIDFKLVNSSNYQENNKNILDQVYEVKYKNKENFNSLTDEIINSPNFELNILIGEQDSGI
jgi:hypothetical protein